MKLGHFVKYHDVFFKLDDGLHPTLPSGVMAICLLKRCPVSKMNSFNLGYIVKYYNVFFKLDNGPCRTLLSGVIVLFHESSIFLLGSGL